MKMRILASLLAILMVFALLPSTAITTSPIRVMLDLTYLEFDVPPMIVNDRTMVPFRAIFEALGMEVYWDDENRVASGEIPGANIHDGPLLRIDIPLGYGHAFVNHGAVMLDAPAIVYNGRTMVPVRFIAEATGASVEWGEVTRTVYISSSSDTLQNVSTNETSVGGSVLGRWVGTDIRMGQRYYDIDVTIHSITDTMIHFSGIISTIEGSNTVPATHPGFIRHDWHFNFNNIHRDMVFRSSGGNFGLDQENRTQTTIVPGAVFGTGIVNLPRQVFLTVNLNDDTVGISWQQGNFTMGPEPLQRP